MNKSLKLFVLLIFSGFLACKNDNNILETSLDQQLDAVLTRLSDGEGRAFFTLPVPTNNDFSEIPQDPKNPLTKAKVDLGALLYHETGLAINPMHDSNEGTYSCATCHFSGAGFQAGRAQGISDGGMGFGLNGEGRTISPSYEPIEVDVQPIRTPSSMNGAYQKVNLWNGQFGATGPNTGTESKWTPDTPIETNKFGYEGLETQAIAGLAVHRMDCDQDWLTAVGYSDLFNKAFPDIDPAAQHSLEIAGLAIGAYERIILANQAPWQQWLRGDNNALSQQEKRGALLFFDKAECGTCHTGPALNTMGFYAYGMKDLHERNDVFNTSVDDGANLGRASFTKNDADNFKFKVPQLYNLTDSPFYGHGASFTSVRDVVAYKNAGVKENTAVSDTQLATEFIPLGLTQEEIDDITAFIEQALYDPNLSRYEPISLLSGNCFPNNDNLSKEDLNCD